MSCARYPGTIRAPRRSSRGGREELLGELQLAQGDGERLWNAFAPIMEHLGIRYAWQRESEAVRMTFEIESA